MVVSSAPSLPSFPHNFNNVTILLMQSFPEMTTARGQEKKLSSIKFYCLMIKKVTHKIHNAQPWKATKRGTAATMRTMSDKILFSYCPASPSSSSLFLFMVGASGSTLMVPEATFIMTLLFPVKESCSLKEMRLAQSCIHTTCKDDLPHCCALQLFPCIVASSISLLLH